MKKRLCTLVLMFVVTAASMTGCVKAVKIGQEDELTGNVKFDAASSAENLWESAVGNIEEKAIDLSAFFEEAGGDMESLADKYGKYSMKTSGTISYAIKGSGVVEEVNQEKKAGYMVIKPDGYDGKVVVKIQIGSIYKGSSTRDSLDIINFGDFTNQQEWAAISQELHGLIDKNVIQPAEPSGLLNKNIEFTGTFTVNRSEEILITPIRLMAK